MSRRIVFAGGMQTRAIARLYRGNVADDMGDDVVFIGSGALGTDPARSAMLLADIVATEVDEDGDAVPTADLPTQATLVRIPNLYADYLWPFAGRSHPKNRGQFVLAGGPYPAEHGDRFLDQMVEEGVDEDEAIRRYLAIDIAKEGELDSRLADRMEIQRKLDQASDFDLADFVAENFRQKQLFRTRQRVTFRLLRRLVRQLLPKLGVQGFNMDRITTMPFPAGAQPVHPGVAAHFDLRWVGADQRYPVNEEGYFTFEQFCRRYMRFTWNEPLHRGIETAKTNPEAALAYLEQGLAVSPESPLGRRARLIVRHARGLEPTAPANTLIDEESYDPAEETIPVTQSAVPRPLTPAADVAPPPAPATTAPEPAAEAPIEQAEAAAVPVSELVSEPEPEASAAPEPEAAPEASTSEASAPEPTAEAPTATPAAPPEPAAEPEDPLEAVRSRYAAPARPAAAPTPQVAVGTTHDGFTDFGTPPSRQEAPREALQDSGASELIDVLPRLLPVFSDLSSAAERPFTSMPEIMPPPPLRPILPPELQNEPAKPGLFSRLLGRKQAH